jgi:hypothetical protein
MKLTFPFALLLAGTTCLLPVENKLNTQQPIIHAEDPAVSAVPSDLNYPAFYKKYLDAKGIPIVSSEKVPDAALYQARITVRKMLNKIPQEAIQKMIDNKVRLAIMAETEVTTDIPEHSDLNEVFPQTNWNTRARGLGATKSRPATSCAEENVLCYPNDRYRKEDILIHEFAHSIHQMGLSEWNRGFETTLRKLHAAAKEKGLWENTYAISNAAEYWAEGVQSFFNVNTEAIPTNGVHNHVNTRAELKAYDPDLYALIATYFDEDDEIFSCHQRPKN